MIFLFSAAEQVQDNSHDKWEYQAGNQWEIKGGATFSNINIAGEISKEGDFIGKKHDNSGQQKHRTGNDENFSDGSVRNGLNIQPMKEFSSNKKAGKSDRPSFRVSK